MAFVGWGILRPLSGTNITAFRPRVFPHPTKQPRIPLTIRRVAKFRCCTSSTNSDSTVDDRSLFAISPLQEDRILRTAKQRGSSSASDVQAKEDEPAPIAGRRQRKQNVSGTAIRKGSSSTTKELPLELEDEEQSVAPSDKLSATKSKVDRPRHQKTISADKSKEVNVSSSLLSDPLAATVDAIVRDSTTMEQLDLLTKRDATKKRRQRSVSGRATKIHHEWPRYESHAELVEDALAMRGDPLEADGGRVVLFRGRVDANVVVIGEGPGAEEDREGLPFVGESGQLLDRIFRYAGFDPEKHLYVTNTVKRRPRDNRKPTTAEVAHYQGLLREELRLIAPKIIVIAGRTALNAVLPDAPAISRIRGKWFQLGDALAIPIFHPSYILRFPSKKALMRDDALEIRHKFLELVPDIELADVSNQGSAGR